MITENGLVECGYKKYDDTEATMWSFSRCFFQRPVKDHKGIRYYIDIVKYSESIWMMHLAINEPRMTLQVHMVEDIKYCEDMAERFWLAMGCCYYEVYE